MLDKSMKHEFKPLTLGVIKEIVKKVDGLVPDDTPVLMDGRSNEYDPKILVRRTIERSRNGDTHIVNVVVIYYGEGGGFDAFGWPKPKLSKQIVWDVTNGIKIVLELTNGIKEASNDG